jgi:UDP-N-acetylglucosamine 2-epimerase
MPNFRKPTINIGNRQKGRIMSNGIINVFPKKSLIKKKINSIYQKKHKIKNIKNCFKGNKVSKKIVLILKSIDLEKYKEKKFYDFLAKTG